MRILYAFLAALIGVLLGGPLGRAAYALPRGEYREILFPRCVSCGNRLSRKCSIPLVGGFLTRFRCEHCGEKTRGISTLLSEVLFGGSCVLLFLVYSFRYSFFLYAVVAGVLLLLSLMDLDIREVSHPLLAVLILLGVMRMVFSFFPSFATGTVWWEHLVGAFVISLPLFLLMIFTGGIGGGDVKLMFCLGLLLGYKLTLVAFLFGIVIAAFWAVVLHFAAGKGGKYQLPLVPFLSLGAIISILFGGQILQVFFA